MKVVIAAWHLKDFNVGLGRYCRGLIEGLGRVDHENRYEILMPNDAYRFPDRPNIRYRLIRFPVFKRRFWEQVAPLLLGRYDLLHFPYDSCVAWKRGKFMITVHDVKPLLFSNPRPRHNLNSLVEQLVVGDKWSKVDRVVTDSECSRQDIVEHLKIPKERVAVVYPGVDRERFAPAPVTPADRGVRPYVLNVAGSDPTKNVETVIDAFARLPLTMRDEHVLVLAGDFRRRPDLYERVRQAGLEKQTQFTGIVSDDRLKELYQRAKLFVFPSRYEGFGLPVLEAMACGCPVISSNASSIPEVAGDAAILLDPMDVEGFTREMVQVMSNSDLRRDLRERGLARAAQFSWDRTARETIAVYRELLQ
jgi:glycosyltransferase involved in cell wall biosynthesis